MDDNQKEIAAPMDARESIEAAFNETAATPEQATTETTQEATTTPKEDSGPLDWAKAPEPYSKAYKELQGEFTKRSQTLKSFEERYKDVNVDDWRGKVAIHDQLEAILSSDSSKAEAIRKIIHGTMQQQQQEDPFLKDDPLYHKYTALERELAEIKNFTNTMQKESSAQKEEARLNQYVQKQVKDALDEFKSMWGRDATQEDKKEIYEALRQDPNVILGKLAVRAAFADKYASHKTQQALQSQQAKKKTAIPSTTMNPSSAKQDATGYLDAREAIEQAMQELGITDPSSLM